MYHQSATINRTDYSNSSNDSPADGNVSIKVEMDQNPPPPYEEYAKFPNAGDLSLWSCPDQQYRAPVAPPGPYTQGPHPGVPVYTHGSCPSQSVFTVQPTVFATSPALTHPLPDYMRFSIFTMLCCCLPLGIAAVVYSITTRDANGCGDRDIAEKSSRTALILNIVGLAIGLVLFSSSITYIILITL